jgi:SAM-dependent methyltransferase
MKTAPPSNIGGYEDGYRACPCFWGRAPGSLLPRLRDHFPDLAGSDVLDAGCGEGKNAAYLARCGAKVLAVDISETALANARVAWADTPLIDWRHGDIRTINFDGNSFHVVLAYGLFHCLNGKGEVEDIVRRLQAATVPGGYHVVCAFNDRAQDLRAHPKFEPTLLAHDWYLNQYQGWDVLYASDEDLHETHPHNGVPHAHSLTRILARKGNDS